MWDTPAGLLGEPLLYHGNGVENWAQWFSAVGAPRRLKLASGFDQVSLLVRAVMADMGIAVLQRCLVRDDLLAGRVAAPPGLQARIARGYHLCAPPQRRDHYALACFRKWLLDTAGADPDVAAAGGWPLLLARPSARLRRGRQMIKPLARGWFLRCRRGKSGRELEAGPRPICPFRATIWRRSSGSGNDPRGFPRGHAASGW